MSIFGKKKNEEPEKNVVQAETADGHEKTTEEVVQEVMEKYDRESNVRAYAGVPRMVVRVMLIAFALFCIYMNFFATWDARVRRSLFLGCIVLFTFLIFPARKHKAGAPRRVNYVPWYDLVFGILGSGAFFYFVYNVQDIIARASRITPVEMVIGIVGILALMEACRRSVGLPILFVATFFVLYAFFGYGAKLKYLVYNLFYTPEGVIGTPIGVCSTFIVLFIIFGAFLEQTGISNFFIKLANSVAGASAGGPAKVAVISSALCGMVSGSSVGNTVTTGSVTIPLMKETGYEPEFAGAVEAAASTGGQIMPPIMGAAAFLMVEMAGESYAKIATSAILPACLYFTGIFIMVHLEAKRLGLKGLSRTELPKFWPLFIKNGYLLLPIVILVYMITSGYTMAFSAIVATAAAIVVSMFKKETRLTPKKFFDALENGTRSTLTVACACGVAGIIAGVITMTGLGQTLISAVVSISGGKIMIAMFLTMLCCIVLGMGVPTTANYVIMATTCAPILIKMGMVPLAAHFFVFYFGIIADITPPVALAAYAGSAIAGSRPMKTALNASMLAIAAFIIPYIFGLNPALLFIDASVFDVILIIITSFIGLFGVAVAVRGYLYDYLTWWQRVLSAAGGLLLIYPGLATDLIGAAIVAVGIGLHILSVRKKQAA